MSIIFAGIKLKNPVFLASGIAGYGDEYAKVFDINLLGGFISKTITLNPRKGNPPPRLVETPSGMINTIGLENPGLDGFIEDKLPAMRKLLSIPIVVSIGGDVTEFTAMLQKLNRQKGIAAIELNLSCPNVRTDASGKAISSKKLASQDRELTFQTVKKVKSVSKYPIIAKLSPAVTDITEIAAACQAAGADALALINTFPAMYFIPSRKPSIKNPKGIAVSGGLSGPAIKPIALRMVHDTAKKVTIPVMAMGGISSVQDAVEFLAVGAKTVAVGCCLFNDPMLAAKLAKELK